MPATEKAGARPGHHATRAARRGRPADDGVQLLPLLRGAVRGVPRDGDAPRVSRRRPELPRQPLPFLRRLLRRLPVLAAARVRRQRAARAGAGARRVLRGLRLAARRWRRCSRATGLRSASSRRLRVAAFILGFVAWHDPAVLFGTHTGPGAFYRLMPHNAMAALFGARVPLRDRRAGAWACARSGATSASRWRLDGRLALAGDPRCRNAALSRWRRHRLLQPRRTAERPPPVLSSPHVLRLRALLRVDLRGDALSLRASAAWRRIRGGTCRWCSARSAASG